MNNSEGFHLKHKDSGKEMNQDFYPGLKIITGQELLSVRDDFTVVGLDEQLQSARETFFINQETAHNLGLDKFMLQNSRFHLRNDWFDGRTDSMQGVYFGELSLGIDNGNEILLPVACKPFRLLERYRAIH